MNKKTNENEKWNENEMNKWTGNRIGAEGANKISEILKVNTTLTKLDLNCDEKNKNEWKIKFNVQGTKLELQEQSR